MFKTFALALVAAASLGFATLTPGTASAGGFGHHHFGHHHGFHGHFGFHGPRIYIAGPAYDEGCTVRRLVPTPSGLRWRWVNRCY